jgi:hypothetical protein
MTPDRCPDCGVLSGSAHHITCGYEPALSPRGQVVRRMSPQPCEWCAEHYPIVSTRQRHHVQNPDCARKARNARDLGHNRRARARKKKPKAHTAYPVIVPNPYAWMRRIALNFGYRALRDTYPDDFAQEIELILLELNLPRSSPVQLDAAAVRNYVRRSLYRVCQEYGFINTREGRPVDRHVDLTPLLNHSQCNWQSAWYQA